MSELPSGDPFSRLVPVTQDEATALPTGLGSDPFDQLIPAEPEQDPFSSLVQVPQEEAANAVKSLGPAAELKWLDARNKSLEILPREDWKRREELIGKLGMWDLMYERNLSGVGDALTGLAKTVGTMTGEIWEALKHAKEDPRKTLAKINATSVEGALRGTLDISDIGEATIKHLAGALDVYVLGAADTDKQTEDLHYGHYVERQQARINRANINKDTVLGTLAGGAEIAFTGKSAEGVETQQELSKLVMPATADVLSIGLSPANALPISAGGRVGTMLASAAARGGATTAGKVALTAGMLNRTLNFGTRAEALIARAMPNLSQTAVKRTASMLSGSAWTGATYVAGDVLQDLTGNDILKNLSYIYGASRVGLASTAVGAGALQAILTQTAQGPRYFSALQRLSRTPGTPMLTAALARMAAPVVTPVVRATRAGIGGAAVGAGFNVGIGLATGEEMPELAGAAAVGVALGFPLGAAGHGLSVLTGADRAKRYQQEVAITRETQRALNGDAAAERFDQMPMNDQLGVGMMQAVAGPTALIEVLDSAEFSKRHGTSAGVHIDNKTPGVLPRIVINADAKRPAGQTVLHEFGHELARQIAPSEIKALFDEFATDEEKKDFADEYITRTVETKRKSGELSDVPGVAEFGKQMADVRKQLDESQPGWLEQEWFAEKSVQAFYGANWKDVLAKGDKADVVKWATLSLRAKRAVLENAGVAFDHIGKVIEPEFISESFKGQGDEQLSKILFQYMKERADYSPVLDATVDHNARADAGKGPVIDFGRTFQRLKTHPAFKGTFEKNPQTGLMENEFSVQMPDGSIVLKNEKDIRAREKAETAEMQKVFATPPVDPDSPLVGPRRILDDDGQATLQVSGQELPKSFYDSKVIPVRQKTKARAVQDVMMDGKGETIDMLYHQIGSEGKASWAAAVKQKLGNVRATFRTVRPINFFVSKSNNLLARVIDVTAYNAKLLRSAEEAQLAEWHNNAEVFDADVKKVMANWATGVPGSTGLEAAKFIRIMDFLGKEGGRNSLIKSFRIDRMEDVRPTGRGGWTFDYGKFKTRAAPSPSPSPAPDVTVRPSPDVPGRPKEAAAAPEEVTPGEKRAAARYSPDVNKGVRKDKPGVRLRDEREKTRQRITSGLAAHQLESGGTGKVVPREQFRPQDIAHPDVEALGVTDGTVQPWHLGRPGIDEAVAKEADRLVEIAKEEGVYLDPDVDQEMRSKYGPPGGGAEHDVWLLPDKKNPIVIRSRIVDGATGSQTETTPSLYLKRLEDNSAIVPKLSMEIIGVSRKYGKTKVWTAQPFVDKTRMFSSDAALERALIKAGWKDLGNNIWRHAKTGEQITDVHRGNILLGKDGKMYAIDIIPVKTGKAGKTGIRFSPDVEPAGIGRHELGVKREERVVGEFAKLTKGELKAIKEATSSKAEADELAATVRDTKARFPTKEGWASMEFTGVDKDGKPVFKNIPYGFAQDRKGKVLKKGSKAYEAQSGAMANRMRDVVREVFDRARAGDEAAKKILSQASWYRAIRTRLRREFGGIGDLFADLLGATSPNTPVRDNWNNAVDSMRRALRGDFDHLIPEWEKWVDEVDAMEADLRTYVNEQLEAGKSTVSITGKAEVKPKNGKPGKPAVPGDPVYLEKLEALKEKRKLGDDMLPAKESGKLYGFNGRNIVKAMVDLWRTVRDPEPIMGQGGTAPKALNFSGNLIGFRKGATIDVWAARMLQRLAGLLRIPIPAEGSVTGKMLSSGETTLSFGFGQDVFRRAVDLIRGDSELATHETLANINPDDLQAVVWFVEKELWARNNWTTEEGGSFEFEADLAGIGDQQRVRELRKVIDSSTTSAEQKSLAIDALDAMKREVDRFIGGLAIERSAGLQGEAFVPSNAEQARTAAQLHTAIYRSDVENNVVAVKAASTEGRYGATERAIDLEVVAREGYDPAPLFEEMRVIGDKEKQDTIFLARILRQDETFDPLFHRAGIEIFFRTSKTGAERAAALETLDKMGAGFHTVVVDARPTTAMKKGEMPPAVGVRILKLPEYDVRFDIDKGWLDLDDATMAQRVKDSRDELHELGDKLMRENPDVNFAEAGYYEVRSEFAHEYAGAATDPSIAGGLRPTREEGWRGRSVREATEAADRRNAAD
jgi:Serine/Threonine/Tyrosine Kinase found in polyvalent proteins